jgi:hypothetical protein
LLSFSFALPQEFVLIDHAGNAMPLLALGRPGILVPGFFTHNAANAVHFDVFPGTKHNRGQRNVKLDGRAYGQIRFRHDVNTGSAYVGRGGVTDPSTVDGQLEWKPLSSSGFRHFAPQYLCPDRALSSAKGDVRFIS